MLESELKKLTSAVVELTAALHTVRLPSSAAASEITPPLAPAPAPDAQGTTTDTAPAAVPEPAPTAEVPAPTKKQLVEKFIELAQTKDREVAVKLLADFGVAVIDQGAGVVGVEHDSAASANMVQVRPARVR